MQIISNSTLTTEIRVSTTSFESRSISFASNASASGMTLLSRQLTICDGTARFFISKSESVGVKETIELFPDGIRVGCIGVDGAEDIDEDEDEAFLGRKGARSASDRRENAMSLRQQIAAWRVVQTSNDGRGQYC